jgi:DNA repair photolyase
MTATKTIYIPKGRAREYAPLAANLYRGCGHACTYCFGPTVTFRDSLEDFVEAHERRRILAKLHADAAQRQKAGKRGRVLLCFTCDPYQPLDEDLALTRQAIEILHNADHHVTILTKGGRRALRDLDLMGPHDAFATTLTFPDTFSGREQSNKWEPHAAFPAERIEAIRAYHDAGVPTWVSLEPVLHPDAALECIRQTADITDLYKVGKLNADHRLALPEVVRAETAVDWRRFGIAAIELLESLGKPYYIKRDLACLLPAEVLEGQSRRTQEQLEGSYRPPVLQPTLL